MIETFDDEHPRPGYRKPSACPWCGDESCGGDAWADGCDGFAAQQRREYDNPIPVDPAYEQPKAADAADAESESES